MVTSIDIIAAPGSIDPRITQRVIRAGIFRAFSTATAIYIVFCVLYMVVSSPGNNNPALPVLHIGSAVSLLVFWRYINWGRGRYDTFGAALLLFYAMYKLQAAADSAVFGARIEDIYSSVPLPASVTLLFLKAEALNHFGILLLVSVWRRVVGVRIDEYSFFNSYRDAGRQLPRLVYFVAIAIAIVTNVAGLNFGPLSQIVGIAYQFGVVSIFFIAARQGNRYRQLAMAVSLAAPLVLLVLGGGVKHAMFFPLVPALLIGWFRFRSISFKAIAIILGFILLAYSQLYIQYVRGETWGSVRSDTTTLQLLQGFQESLPHVSLVQGMDDINSRINMTINRAMTVAIADARGFEPYNIFAPIPASLIPRAFWPNKPALMPGAQHTLRIRNQENMPLSAAGTSTAAGFFSELYLGGGFIGWALGIASYAFLLGSMQRYTLRTMKGFGHIALSFLTVYWALRFEEKAIVYAYAQIFFTFIFLVALTSASSLLMRRRVQF